MIMHVLLASLCLVFFCLRLIRRPPRSTRGRSSAASDVYERQAMIFSAQWLLQVRRTIPAGDLDTRVGDWLVRIAQLLSLLYLAIGLVASSPARYTSSLPWLYAGSLHRRRPCSSPALPPHR